LELKFENGMVCLAHGQQRTIELIRFFQKAMVGINDQARVYIPRISRWTRKIKLVCSTTSPYQDLDLPSSIR